MTQFNNTYNIPQFPHNLPNIYNHPINTNTSLASQKILIKQREYVFFERSRPPSRRLGLPRNRMVLFNSKHHSRTLHLPPLPGALPPPPRHLQQQNPRQRRRLRPTNHFNQVLPPCHPDPRLRFIPWYAIHHPRKSHRKQLVRRHHISPRRTKPRSAFRRQFLPCLLHVCDQLHRRSTDGGGGNAPCPPPWWSRGNRDLESG